VADSGRHPLAARLAALRDEDVDPALRGLARLGHGVDLVDDLGPGGVDAVHERPGIPQRERDRGRRLIQRRLERRLVDQRHDVIDDERPSCQRAHPRHLVANLIGGAEDGGHAAQPSGLRHGRDQLGRRRGPDRRLQHGHLEVEQPAEVRMQQRIPPSRGFSAIRTGGRGTQNTWPR
jgi:hypothetical protein